MVCDLTEGTAFHTHWLYKYIHVHVNTCPSWYWSHDLNRMFQHYVRALLDWEHWAHSLTRQLMLGGYEQPNVSQQLWFRLSSLEVRVVIHNWTFTTTGIQCQRPEENVVKCPTSMLTVALYWKGNIKMDLGQTKCLMLNSGTVVLLTQVGPLKKKMKYSVGFKLTVMKMMDTFNVFASAAKTLHLTNLTIRNEW